MSEENNTLTTRVKTLLDETKKLNERFERQISFLETLPQIYKQNNLFTKDYEQGLERPHETWVNTEKDFPCYNKNENHKHPHIYHSFNPQLNNITDMINYLIKNCCNQRLSLQKGGKNKEKIEETEKPLFRSQSLRITSPNRDQKDFSKSLSSRTIFEDDASPSFEPPRKDFEINKESELKKLQDSIKTLSIQVNNINQKL